MHLESSVSIVGLGESALLLDVYKVIASGGCVLGSERSHVALSLVDHYEHLPRVPVLRDAFELDVFNGSGRVFAVSHPLEAADESHSLPVEGSEALVELAAFRFAQVAIFAFNFRLDLDF